MTRQVSMRNGSAIRPRATDTARFRVLPVEVRGATYLAHRRLYKNKQKADPRSEQATIHASVLLISGCQDEQLSSDGDRNGLFTSKLLSVWNQGRFQGNYRKLHQEITSQMSPVQIPNLFTFGQNGAQLEAAAVFTIA